MKDTSKFNFRLSFMLLLVMVASMVLAACGSPAQQTAVTDVATAAATAVDPAVGGTTPTAAAQTGDTTPATDDETAIDTTAVVVGGTPALGATGDDAAAGAGGADCGVTGELGPLEEVADANPNGELVYNLEQEPENGDPQVSSFVNEIQFNSPVFLPLFSLNEENQPVFGGAESCTLTNGGKTWTLTIREHNYSDGKPVTANDYANAILRSCDPDVAGNYSYVMYDIVGCQEFRESTVDAEGNEVKLTDAQKQALREKVQVKATDERTLEITIKSPVGYFAFILSLWTTYPVRQDLVEKGGERWWAKPETFIGNGPFKLTQYSATRISYDRNENFFRGTPRLAKLRYELIVNEPRFVQGYQRGDLDAVDITGESLRLVQGNEELSAGLIRAVEASTFYIALDNTIEPFQKVQVRQAFAAALDRELAIRQVRQGVGKVAGSFLYPGIAGYQEETKQTFDPERAKQLLAEGGYPNGQGFPKLILPYRNDDDLSKKLAVFYAQQFKKVLNVDITPRATDPVQLVAARKSTKPEERPDIYLSGWFQDYPHPQNWVSLVFAPLPSNSLAPLGWNDKEYLDLIQRADRIADVEEAAPLYAQADARLAELAPAIFTNHGEVLSLVKPYVKGYVDYPGDPLGLARQSESIYVTNEKE